MSTVTSSTHTTPLYQRAIALAALTQAAYLVDSIARKGAADAEDSKALLESIFFNQKECPSPAEIYGGLQALRTGIRSSHNILAGKSLPQSKMLMGYIAGLLAIEKRVSKNHDMCCKLADGIARIDKQKVYFGSATHSSIIAAVADLYGETISTVKPRIIVRGKSEYLSQNSNTQRVRALLMAGVRAAHLWHEGGGGHLTLLFRRKTLLRQLDQLQSSISS